MSERCRRFTDTECTASPRSFNQPHPCASIPVPDIATVKKVLTSELCSNQLYKNVWEQAKVVLIHKKKTLSPDHFKSSTPEECYVAVIAYTIETSLYRDFNSKFRQMKTKASWDGFPYKSFYYLLTLARPGIKNNPSPNGYLYRGLANFHFSSSPKYGDYFYFDYSVSCSADKYVAEAFMGNNGTMITIQDGAEEAMGITSYYSQYADGEVLVFPRNRFQVVEFRKTGKKDEIVLSKAGTI